MKGAGFGGVSGRTIQCWYHSQLVWLQVMWILFTSQLWKVDHEYIAAGDEFALGKAGQNYSFRFLKVVRVREFPSSNLGTPIHHAKLYLVP